MLIEVEHLSKAFGQFKAVDDVSFFVNKGEIVGLVGPNGAGKTTIISMILGLISPSGGRIRLFGRSLDSSRSEILQRVNFMSPYAAFPVRLTVHENLDIFGRMYKVPNRRAKIAGLLNRFGIERLADKPVSRLSSGEVMRVGLCKCFLNDPELLLLDEPTAYLDPHAALHVRDILLDLQRKMGTTVLYTSHNMREVQRVCGRVIFLVQGRIGAAGTPIEVTRQILKEDRDRPCLEEVFLHVAGRMAG